MKLIEGNEYQIESIAHRIVHYDVAKLATRLFNGERVVQFCSTTFSADGQALTFDRYTSSWVVDLNPLNRVSEVDSDRKRRRQAGNRVSEIARDVDSMRGGKNANVFSCGTASDEIISQVERVQKEVAKLREMLEATHA